jgi:hypothetical protein
MPIADIIFAGVLTTVTIISAAVLIGQFVRGDLAQPHAHARRHVVRSIAPRAGQVDVRHHHRPHAA